MSENLNPVYTRRRIMPPDDLHSQPWEQPAYLPGCRCGAERRGPAGGVCGRCGNAIPSKENL